MRVCRKISLDFAQSQNPQCVDAMQGDTARFIEFYLYDGGAVFIPPDGASASVSFKKPDGTGGTYDALPDGTAAYEISENVITVALEPQVLTVPGKVNLSVGIVSGERKLYTFSVIVNVQPNPGLQATSDNYFQVIGALPNSGWEPQKYLGTDATGNVVAVDAPAGGGVTAEQAAQIQANTEAIADIRDPVVSGNTHWDGNTATITMPLASGGSDVIKAEFDDNANLTKVTVNGREIPWTTTGV